MPTPEELMESIDRLMSQGVGHINVVEGEVHVVEDEPDDPGEEDFDEEGKIRIDTRKSLECENSPVPMACGVPTVFVEGEE